MKSANCLPIFLMGLFMLGAHPAGARTLDGSHLPLVGAFGKTVVTATSFDLVLRAKAAPADAVDWQADEEIALSAGVLSKNFNIRTESNFAATARAAALAKDGPMDRVLNTSDDFDGLPIVPQRDGGVISSLRGTLELDWPIADDYNQTITATAVSFTQGAGTEDIPELPGDFWLTPGMATPNPWPILEPLMAEGTVFMGLLVAIGAAWGISRHRQLMEP